MTAPLRVGDVFVGVPSVGLRTNGYSHARGLDEQSYQR